MTSNVVIAGLRAVCASRWARSALVLACAGVLGAASCNSETLFQAAFTSAAAGSPPAHTQATGTINLDGPSNSVLVVGPPPNVSGNWARITRTSSQTSVTAMQCNLTAMRGPGTYNLIANMYIPTGTQTVSLQFESFGQAPSDYQSFLHLDFLPNNTVRINDEDASAFGSFTRDQAFVVTVLLTIGAGGAASAHIELFGAASGTADHTTFPFPLPQEFGAVRFWVGWPWTGSFYVSDVIVTRQTN